MNLSTLVMLSLSMLVVQALPPTSLKKTPKLPNSNKEEKVNHKTVSTLVKKKTQADSDQVEIPEEMYTAMKPITKYFFKNIQKLLTKSNTKEESKKLKKTKKITKDFFNALVNPLARYYGKHMRALRPLTSTVEETHKSKVPTDPRIQHSASYGGGPDPFQDCIDCLDPEKEKCMICNVMHGIICCIPGYP